MMTRRENTIVFDDYMLGELKIFSLSSYSKIVEKTRENKQLDPLRIIGSSACWFPTKPIGSLE